MVVGIPWEVPVSKCIAVEDVCDIHSVSSPHSNTRQSPAYGHRKHGNTSAALLVTSRKLVTMATVLKSTWTVYSLCCC